jgi:hypothetical protein
VQNAPVIETDLGMELKIHLGRRRKIEDTSK